MGQSPSFDRLSDLHEMSLDKTGKKPNVCNHRISRPNTKHLKAPCETSGACGVNPSKNEEHKEVIRENKVVTKSTFYDPYA